MIRFAQYTLTGLSAGSLYALVALGLVLIYRSTRVLNFAHGDVATVATFVAFSLLSRQYSFGVALAASLAWVPRSGSCFTSACWCRRSGRAPTCSAW
jgi:branched-chain amino acid transport system permease protein